VAVTALITWSAAVLAGLYMLTVWLIENDVTARRTAPSQLPVPVLFSHLALALVGLGSWVGYLVLDSDTLAWTSFGALCLIVLLGLSMFARWIPVYREPVAAAVPGHPLYQSAAVPAEGNFPVVVVAAHGLLAGGTLVLVFLAAMGVGGS
jgi:hypothetical protein